MCIRDSYLEPKQPQQTEAFVPLESRVETSVEMCIRDRFCTANPMRVATIPVGYADGYPRGLSNKGDVLIAGKRARILGRVCMDQFMVDVTKIPEAKVGDIATLIGTDGIETITMEEIGDRSGRFNYETACCLGKRIPRVYEKGGKIVCKMCIRDSLSLGVGSKVLAKKYNVKSARQIQQDRKSVV